MKFVERELLIFSRRVARRIARKFGLHYRGVHLVDKRRKEHKTLLGQTTEDELGRCYIELVMYTNGGKLYTLPRLIDTICHELSHIATWSEEAHHSKNWRAWYKKIKNYTFTRLL